MIADIYPTKIRFGVAPDTILFSEIHRLSSDTENISRFYNIGIFPNDISDKFSLSKYFSL